MKTSDVGRRARTRREIANDERIRDAAATQLAEHGVDNLSLWSVARSIDMSHTAMTQRYEDVDDLLCDLWVHIGEPCVVSLIGWSATQFGHNEMRNGESVAVPIKPPIQKSVGNHVTLELMALSCTIPKLRSSVQETFDRALTELAANEPVAAAQTVFVLAMLIGIMSEQRIAKATANDIIAVLSAVIEAASQPGSIASLPPVDASHMRQYAFETGDERKDRILASCLGNVGRHGLAKTTTKMIARDAAVSEGVIFTLYESKTDIFFEATALQSRLGYRANLEFIVGLNETYGTGIGNAILIRELLAPHLRQYRAALLEETRITWHDAELRRRIAKVKNDLVADSRVPGWKESMTPFERAVQFVTLALPIGLYVIAEVFPPAAELPFSSVTVPVFV